MEDKSIKFNIKEAIMVCVGGVFLVAICVYFAFFDFREATEVALFHNGIVYWFIKIFMVLVLLFLAGGIAFILKSIILYRNNIVELHSEYLVDRSSAFPAGRVYYRDISSVYIKGMFLCIKLKDAEGYYKKSNVFKRIFMRFNKEFNLEYITIGDNFVDINLHELKKLISDRMPREDGAEE